MRKDRITFDELPTLVESLLRKFENTENRIDILKSEINDIKQLHAKTHINSKHIPVTIGRAAEIIGLAKPSLYRYTANGLIPCYKRGKRLYFFEDELYDWIRRGKLEELEIAHKDDPCPLVQLTPRQSKKRI